MFFKFTSSHALDIYSRRFYNFSCIANLISSIFAIFIIPPFASSISIFGVFLFLGFLLEAFKYGTPPHGGIAFGLDRLIMLLAGEESIREVIAFPKTQNASCPLTNAPSEADNSSLIELGIGLLDI